MNYCGIDLASKASAICVMDSLGAVLEKLEIPTDEDGFRVALSRWSELKCVLEASPLAEWAAQQVEMLGYGVSGIDPRQANAVMQTKKKTDRRDAHNLAQLGRTGWFTAGIASRPKDGSCVHYFRREKLGFNFWISSSGSRGQTA